MHRATLTAISNPKIFWSTKILTSNSAILVRFLPSLSASVALCIPKWEKTHGTGFNLAGMCQELSETMNAQGTPSYLAPEVVLAWSGRPYSHTFTDRIDIFAFGVTLVNVITGEYPFERITARLKSRVPFSDDEFGQHFNISEKCLTKLKLLDPVYATLAQLCLSIDPANRPSAAQLLEMAPGASN